MTLNQTTPTTNHNFFPQVKTVFFGTPDFAVESLKALHEAGCNIAAVVTMPDKRAGRGHKLIQSPVKQYAQENGIPVLQPEKLKNTKFLDELRKIDAQLFIVIAFRMLPREVWQMPALGTFNLHASLLPRYRGAAPINHAVMNGDTRTGVTTFFLKHEIDTGDILAQEEIEIGPDENVGSVHDRLMTLGAKLTVKTVRDIAAGTVNPIPQEQLAKDLTPCPAPKIFTETCRIDWSQPLAKVHNFVRGLSPYPAAWSVLRSNNSAPQDVKIFTTRKTQDPTSGAPGAVEIRGDRMLVNCADGVIEILDLRPAGKKRMDTASFLRGARLHNPFFE